MDVELFEPVIAAPTAAEAVLGYSQSTVDEFLAAAAEERTRLVAALSEAKARQAETRSAIGMHRVMLSMLLEAQEELQTRRREAEAAADEVLRRADREAETILAAAQPAPVSQPEPEPTREAPAVESLAAPEPVAVSEPADVIDLRKEHQDENQFGTSNGAARQREPVFTTANAGPAAAASSEEFFTFLRGALVDQDPLGPRYE
jgi:hypothetical protein